jgi:putative FmdB family regulatory protein
VPTYEYLCSACGHRFDHFQAMRDKRLRKCPECAKPALERLIGAGAGIVFKGSGFYQTDYRSDGYKQAAEKDNKKPEDSSKSTKDTGSGDGGKPTTGSQSGSDPADKKKG